MEEIWKDIPGYEGLYQVSNMGKVKSLHYGKEYILSPGVGGRYNYLFVILSKNAKRTKKYIHIAMWESFNGPIPKGYDVHHKKQCENGTFINILSNLELKDKRKHVSDHQSIPILQFDRQGNFIKEWPSMTEVERQLGIVHNSISACCLGKYGHKTAGGYVWKYK